MHVSLALLAAHFFMLVAEAPDVREDRDLCCLVGILINYFYLTAAALLLMKSYATFKAVTDGVIAGMTHVYLGRDSPSYS
jgi:hypothetical protein